MPIGFSPIAPAARADAIAATSPGPINADQGDASQDDNSINSAAATSLSVRSGSAWFVEIDAVNIVRLFGRSRAKILIRTGRLC